MRIKLFSQVQNLKSSLFSKSTPFCIFLIALTTSFLLSPTCATAASPSLKQEVLEQGFRRSLTEIKQLVSHRPSPTCFISRVCEDDTWGDRIEFYLRQLGVQTIYDKKDLRGNDDIQAFVERINTADFVMTLFSPRYLENYGKRTWIYNEAGLIKQRLLRGERGFHIPILLAGRAGDSMPPDFLDSRQTDYLSMTAGSHLADEDTCYESLFRVLKEQLFRGDFEEGAPSAVKFCQIKGRFDARRSKLPPSFPCTEFQSATGFFPQSLKTYNAFLDRTDETGLSYLDRIFEELFINEDATTRFSTTTLCASGMGGVGKTTLATEYARKYGAFYNLVYWMDGGSKGEFLRSCLALLEALKVPLPERGNADEETYYSDVIRLVNDNLSGMRRHSLLVIDNVEDPALVAELSPSKGHILYTSRSNSWLRKIDIDVLKREESINLLLQLTGLDPSFSGQAGVLAEELGDLPLALAQAAAYIKQQKLPFFQVYLEHYRASQADLLTKKQIQPSLNKREAVVMTTWNTTMKKVSADAQKLMRYFSYLDPNIYTEPFETLERCNEAILELQNYSMLKQDSESHYVKVHGLIQLVNRLLYEAEFVSGANHPHDEHILGNMFFLYLDYWGTNLMSTSPSVIDFVEENGTYNANLYLGFLANSNRQALYELHKRLNQVLASMPLLSNHLTRLKRDNIFEMDQAFHLKVLIESLWVNLRFFIKNSRSTLLRSERQNFRASASQPVSFLMPVDNYQLMREELKISISDFEELVKTARSIMPSKMEPDKQLELLKILLKISNTKQRTELVLETRQVFEKETEENDYIGVLKTIARIRPEELGEILSCTKEVVPPESTRGAVSVIYEIVKLHPSSRRENVFYAKQLMTEKMGEYSRSQIIRAMSKFPPEEMPQIVFLVHLLFGAELGLFNDNIIIEAMHSLTDIIPSRREEIVLLIKPFVIRELEPFDCLSFFESFSDKNLTEVQNIIGLFQPLMTSTMSDYDRMKMAPFVASLDPSELEEIVFHTHDLMTKTGVNLEKRGAIFPYAFLPQLPPTWLGRSLLLYAFSKIAPQQRQDVSCYAQQLITSDMYGESCSDMMEVLDLLEATQRPIFVQQALALVPTTLHWLVRTKMIRALALHESVDRAEFSSHLLSLLTSAMSWFEQFKLVEAVSEVATDQQISVLSSTRQLVTPKMSGQERGRVVNVLASTPTRQHAELIGQIRLLLNPELNIKMGDWLIRSLSKIPSEQRLEVFSYALQLAKPGMREFDFGQIIEAVFIAKPFLRKKVVDKVVELQAIAETYPDTPLSLLVSSVNIPIQIDHVGRYYTDFVGEEEIVKEVKEVDSSLTRKEIKLVSSSTIFKGEVDHVPLKFQTEENGFDSLKVSKDEAIWQTVKGSSKEDIREFVGEEIKQAFLEDMLPHEMKKGVYYKKLKSSHTKIQEFLEEIMLAFSREIGIERLDAEGLLLCLRERGMDDEASSLLEAMNQMKVVENSINAWCKRRDTYRLYVSQYFNAAEWMRYNQDSRFSIEILARLNHLNVNIWDRDDADLYHLKLVHQISHGIDDRASSIHLLQADGVLGKYYKFLTSYHLDAVL